MTESALAYHVKFRNSEQAVINQIRTTLGFCVDIRHYDDCYEVHTEYEFVYQTLLELRAFHRGEETPLFNGERVTFDGDGEDESDQDSVKPPNGN